MAINPTSLNTPYLFLTGTVLIAVAALFLQLQPTMDEANSIQQTIASDAQILAETQQFLNSLDAKTQQLQALIGVESQMATILPESQRPQDAIRVLHEYAAQSSVILRDISNNSATNDAQANAARARGENKSLPETVNILSFKINLTGAYEQVRLFLTLLGKSPRIVDVTGITFNQAKEPENISADIDIQLYSQQPALKSGK